MVKHNRNKKNKHRVQANNPVQSTAHYLSPRGFFKQIGIVPLVGPNEKGSENDFLREVEKRLGKQIVDDYIRASKTTANWSDIGFCYPDLKLTKIHCGVNFNHIRRIATELTTLEVPPEVRVLDLGGGPGHLAFWMAEVWEEARVTVADRFPDTGTKWAEEIGESRVRFIDTTLFDITNLQGEQFDVIVLSRVLSNMPQITLPISNLATCSTGAYLQLPKAQQTMTVIEQVAQVIESLLAPGGWVVVVESWSDTRIMLVGRAFEKQGLFIDINHFHPERVALNYSIILFSHSGNRAPIADLPLGLSVMLNTGDKKGAITFCEMSAECLRDMFSQGRIVASGRIPFGGGRYMNNELLEFRGHTLLYQTSDQGARQAYLSSAINIPQFLRAAGQYLTLCGSNARCGQQSASSKMEMES